MEATKFNKEKEEYREVEEILKGYRDLLDRIETIKEEMRELKEFYLGCGAIEYRECTGTTYKFNSSVENEVVDKEKRLAQLNIELTRCTILKNRIDNAVSKLEDVDKKVIEYRYINKRSLGWKEIAFAINYSESHCRNRIKPRAIKSMIRHIIY
ncbi:TPA: hypothetical protein ACG0NJ_002193 [Clostridium perfringens]|jgi:RinA family phage transcriptional activator|uniref:hypothetical protein n=1 Tax=Clostridium perfringens TaxID=1502 RepID=UPI001CCAF24F|nr:hypothetical protein [Clostridium perfringens]UBK67528.1 hypothetical protein KLF46_13920 [Clostridium perfringens]